MNNKKSAYLDDGKKILKNYIKEKSLVAKYLKNVKGGNMDNKNKIKDDVNVQLLINKFCVNEVEKNNKKDPDNNYEYNNNYIEDIIKEINVQQESIKLSLETYNDLKNVKVKLNGKLVIGFGGQSTNEVDITLHHTYGIPYIPGSCIKGSLRNYIIEEYYGSDEERAKKDTVFIWIFGGLNKDKESVKGNVIFMDAFPANNKFKLSKEVMAAHHQNYNSADNSDSLPLDNDPVNLIFYLVVEENKKDVTKKETDKTSMETELEKLKIVNNTDEELFFNINISIKKTNDIQIIDNNVKEKIADINSIWYGENSNLSEIIVSKLKEMLEFKGLGAKTSTGYGYFNV